MPLKVHPVLHGVSRDEMQIQDLKYDKCLNSWNLVLVARAYCMPHNNDLVLYEKCVPNPNTDEEKVHFESDANLYVLCCPGISSDDSQSYFTNYSIV